MTVFAEISPNPFRHDVICSLLPPPKDSGHFKQHFEYTFDITLTFSNLLSRLSPCLSTEAAKEMSINGCLFQNIIFIISGRLDRSCAIFHVMEGHTVTTAFAKYVSLRGKGVKEIQKGFSPGDTHNICDLCLYASRDKSVIFLLLKMSVHSKGPFVHSAYILLKRIFFLRNFNCVQKCLNRTMQLPNYPGGNVKSL